MSTNRDSADALAVWWWRTFNRTPRNRREMVRAALTERTRTPGASVFDQIAGEFEYLDRWTDGITEPGGVVEYLEVQAQEFDRAYYTSDGGEAGREAQAVERAYRDALRVLDLAVPCPAMAPPGVAMKITETAARALLDGFQAGELERSGHHLHLRGPRKLARRVRVLRGWRRSIQLT